MSDETRITVGDVALGMLQHQYTLTLQALECVTTLHGIEKTLCHDDQVDYLERRIRYFSGKVERLKALILEAKAVMG